MFYNLGRFFNDELGVMSDECFIIWKPFLMMNYE